MESTYELDHESLRPSYWNRSVLRSEGIPVRLSFRSQNLQKSNASTQAGILYVKYHNSMEHNPR